MSGALEHAEAGSEEQQGEPKQANFRSVSASELCRSLGVSLCFRLFSLPPVILPGCLSASPLTGFCQSLRTPQAGTEGTR